MIEEWQETLGSILNLYIMHELNPGENLSKSFHNINTMNALSSGIQIPFLVKHLTLFSRGIVCNANILLVELQKVSLDVSTKLESIYSINSTKQSHISLRTVLFFKFIINIIIIKKKPSSILPA